jgi:hypothetical protein
MNEEAEEVFLSLERAVQFDRKTKKSIFRKEDEVLQKYLDAADSAGIDSNSVARPRRQVVWVGRSHFSLGGDNKMPFAPSLIQRGPLFPVEIEYDLPGATERIVQKQLEMQNAIESVFENVQTDDPSVEYGVRGMAAVYGYHVSHTGKSSAAMTEMLSDAIVLGAYAGSLGKIDLGYEKVREKYDAFAVELYDYFQDPIDNFVDAMVAVVEDFSDLRTAANNPRDTRLHHDWRYGQKLGETARGIVDAIGGAAIPVAGAAVTTASVIRSATKVFAALNAVKRGVALRKAVAGLNTYEAKVANFLARRYVPKNVKHFGLDELYDASISPAKIRSSIAGYLADGVDVRELSVSVARVDSAEGTKRYIAISGDARKWNGPDAIEINGVEYRIVVSDKGGISPVVYKKTRDGRDMSNRNHAEQKLMNLIDAEYQGGSATVSISVQNTSKELPGLCGGCGMTSYEFAKRNPGFVIKYYEGSTGERK